MTAIGAWATSWKPAWRGLLAGCVLAVGLADALLLLLATGFFTSGFQAESIGSVPSVLGFFAASAWLDVFLLLGIWGIVLPLVRWLRTPNLQAFIVAGLIGAGIPASLIVWRYNVYTVAGDKFNLALIGRLPDVSSSSVMIQVLEVIPMLWVISGLTVGLLVLGAMIVARRMEARQPGLPALFAAPPTAALWVGCGLAFVGGMVVLAAPTSQWDAVRFGLKKKASGTLLLDLAQRVTDLDRDGFGSILEPTDSSPFDATIHPYAVEIPGNGIDENQLAGDQPDRFEPLRAVPVPALAAGRRPDVLLIYLESFRFDLLHARLRGQEITPFLNELAASGASTEHMYVHTPWTLTSRAQLFGGRLLHRTGESTLIDDFKEAGYTVGHFSGQDESYGDSVSLLGVDRADVFYDARHDIDRRTSRSAEPVSLQVSWKTVNARVFDFLERTPRDRPLFLYVNLVDTHFPYHHREVDVVLDVTPLRQSQIRSDRADEVFATYANTAANVDRAVAQLVARWREGRDPTEQVIVVTADHGESLYDERTLGHGQSLGAIETRVPLILWGIGGDWPEPLGASDVRGLLRRNLASDAKGRVPRARFVPDPARSVIQYAPQLEAPWLVGLRSYAGVSLYDFRVGRLSWLGHDDRPLDPADGPAQALERTIWNWESLQRAAATR